MLMCTSSEKVWVNLLPRYGRLPLGATTVPGALVCDAPPTVIEPAVAPERNDKFAGINTAGVVCERAYTFANPYVNVFRTLGETMCVSCKPSPAEWLRLLVIKFGSAGGRASVPSS